VVSEHLQKRSGEGEADGGIHVPLEEDGGGSSGAARGGAGRTGRHFTGATNLQKLYRKNSRENSDRKFHVCLRAMKTKHYSHRAPVVDTVGYDIGSH